MARFENREPRELKPFSPHCFRHTFITRCKKNGIPYEIIQRIMEKTGCSFGELTGWKKPIPDPLEVANTWEKADFTKKTIVEYIATAIENESIPEEFKQAYLEDLRSGVILNLIRRLLS